MLRPFRSISPIVDPSAFVDASAQVIGDVHIGPESSIWVNANYVRYRLEFRDSGSGIGDPDLATATPPGSRTPDPGSRL